MSRGAPISDENCHPSGAWSAEMRGECEIAAGIRREVRAAVLVVPELVGGLTC